MNPLIVIPTHNEIDNIEQIILSIKNIMEGRKYSILVVDDASIDGTKETILDMQTLHHNLYFLSRKRKYGLASAYVAGFKFGIKRGFDAFIQMDADFSHNPAYLTNIFDLLEENDVVVASRNVRGGKTVGWSFFRNLISKLGSSYARFILNCPIYDLTGGFNAWKLDALKRINLNKIISKGYSFQIEMKYRAYQKGCAIVEFPIIFEDRKYGKSKMSKTIFFEALLNVIKLRLTV